MLSHQLSESVHNVPSDILEPVKTYLKSVCPPLLFAESTGSVLIENCFESHDSQDVLARFIGSSECNAILVERHADDTVKLSLDVRMHALEKVITSVAVIKVREQPIDANRPVFSQLQVINMAVDEELQSGEEKAATGDAAAAAAAAAAAQSQHGGVSDSFVEEMHQSYFMRLHQLTKHFYAPLARSAARADSSGSGSSAVSVAGVVGGGNEYDDNIVNLQKRIRELDVALEQCQLGTSVPSITLPTTHSIEFAAKLANKDALRNHLDKYSASSVDQFLGDVGLVAAISEVEEDKEEFIHQVNRAAKVWPQEIIRQTRLTDSPFAGTVEKELNFWKDLDKKLNETKEQLNSTPIMLTKLVLKRTNRVIEQRVHEAESMLDRALSTVHISLSFLRDFPIEELQSAMNLHPKLSKCVANCLNHFSKLKHSNYDFNRAVRLLEVLGNLVQYKIEVILREQNIMECPLDDLRRVRKEADAVFSAWKVNLTTQRNTLKEVARRKNEKNFNFKFELEKFQQRVHAVLSFREQHEKLLNILAIVMQGNEGEFLTDLSEGYQLVLRTCPDVLDLSSTGAATWASSMQLYEKKLEKVEERVTHILEDRLSTAKTADEMFRIFAVFNPLFFRSTIRAAVTSFRATLVKNVSEDVRRLQDKFKQKYDASQERVTAELRDIPPLSGRIIWARQIENQLATLMSRIKDVLGVGWEDHQEGKKLKDVCDELRNYLDTNQIYDEWLQKQLKPDVKAKKNVKEFMILVEEDPRSLQRYLRVNFDDKLVVVFKEVKYLEWLLPTMAVAHKTIPSSIKSKAAEAYSRYPTALAMQSILTTFQQTKRKIRSDSVMLLYTHFHAVREVVNEAIGGSIRNHRWIKWGSPDTNEWVHSLSSKVYALQERVDDLNDKLERLEELVVQLKSCPYDNATFHKIVSEIQAIVDELPMRGLSNIAVWVKKLDKRLEAVIRDRMHVAIAMWTAAFSEENHEAREQGRVIRKSGNALRSGGTASPRPVGGSMSPRSSPRMDPNRGGITPHSFMKALAQSEEKKTKPDNALVLEHTVHEIILSNQILYLSPPLESARKYWITELHNYLSIAGSLPRIVASRYQVFAESDSSPQNYTNLLKELDPKLLKGPYLAMESKLAQAKEYAQSWMQYQALWDASVVVVAETLQRDIGKWKQLLWEIKKARSSVDGDSDESLFGPIVINHRQVQTKINVKYDTWQKESQQRFGTILSEEIKSTHADLVATKTRLESIILEGPTKDVIIGVEFILKTKNSLDAMTTRVDDLKASEKLLQTQRFQFPQDWLPVSNVVSTFADLTQILERRVSAMDVQLPMLQLKIKEEDAAINVRLEQFMDSWQANKPVQGHLNPNEVLQSLGMFAGQLGKLVEDCARINGAKEALNMDFVSDDRLSFIQAEISDLREAWAAVSPTFDKLQSICAEKIKDLSDNAPKIRHELEDLSEEIRNLPPKVRSYSAVEHMLSRLAKYLEYQHVMKDICTDTLKERHWKTLLNKMGIKHSINDLTVGHIYESNPLSQQKIIGEILATAAGEMGLEQFLRDLREFWVACELQLVARDRVKIVVGWEVLFSALEDNLSSLASLKQSPYFRNVHEFQEDGANWETRLTNLRGILDVWVEVQRKWIYLRGIFKNADIKAQLPAQDSKFKSIDSEYLNLMKRVSVKPSALDLLQVDGLLRQLERQDSTMEMIKKALGDYLEKQRQVFPRFYFVNNDDLVEIMGNANEPAKIVPHLGKMFQAISSIAMRDATGQAPGAARALSMCSKEGESVPFTSMLDISVGVKDWLAELERQMAATLAARLEESLAKQAVTDNSQLLEWVDSFPGQVVILASQVYWAKQCETALRAPDTAVALEEEGRIFERKLRTLSECVLQDMEPALRKKCEQLLTELVHQRDVIRALISSNIAVSSDFGWMYHLRFYWRPAEKDLMQRLQIQMSNASFFYGFEYLGIGERLVQTPLTDRCYLTLTQALHFRLGANPFGPAGTGKTESVKMLGAQLGRFCLVFNCDSAFDDKAMVRIFQGLCQVGAWGCFDEFNRLEERILSAVSQQILIIQKGLLNNEKFIDLNGSQCKLSTDVGIFVTMNPGYAGRSNLPDNLKQLFRAVAMSAPNRKLIAQVMLYSQGVVTAEALAGKIVLLFMLCEEQLSVQPHYDFGLRALKSVLVGAGDLKRRAVAANAHAGEDNRSERQKAVELEQVEMKVLIEATCDSIVPKLVPEDLVLFTSLLHAVFPGAELPIVDEVSLIEELKKVCEEDCLIFCEEWGKKVLQLKQVLDVRHGVMVVGPSGSGKSTAWRTLFKALSRVDNSKGEFFVIDPKAISKEHLYGVLDPNTLEWTDGVFTSILRKLTDPTTARVAKRNWIMFDGDVDPEWAENLNSVLDDNKLLTLPSGDRLKIPPNVRIMMEVDTLKYATLATVSRCGMIWFPQNTVPVEVLLKQQMLALKKNMVRMDTASYSASEAEQHTALQLKFTESIEPMFDGADSLVGAALEFSESHPHVMETSIGQKLNTLNTMLVRGIHIALEYNDANTDDPMTNSHIEQFATKWVLLSVIWSFSGSMGGDQRVLLAELLMSRTTVELPSGVSLLDLSANIRDGDWVEWQTMVGSKEIDSSQVNAHDVVITTTDTVRHVEVLKAWLASHKPLILCGPPGSGKTMTLTSVLESMPEFILAPLDFSSGTTPDLIMKTFAQYCEVVDSPDGLVLQPSMQTYGETNWLVVFCDECNLPAADMYGTQAVIMFIRQLTEQGGYWNKDCKWVRLRRIQFVGACNPPTDAGREPMSQRFLLHAPLLLVDYPSEQSLKQIYRVFNHGLLKMFPNLRNMVDPINDAMVHYWLENHARFTPDIAPQYIYSPRELSRWVRAMFEAMVDQDAMTEDELVRLWAHEAMRLFQDRLITAEEKEWAWEKIDQLAGQHFPGIDLQVCLQRPILYSNWIKKTYESTDREVLRAFISARLKVFYEEELDVPLVVFDEVLDHVLRIDNVLSHPMGHMLLVGEAGVGKTVLTRFVSWNNGLSVFQIKANNRYTIVQFDEDLRALLRRVGVDGEKVCFIFDESNALSSAFLERMNALLASGEVPGLFEGDERSQLLVDCKNAYNTRKDTKEILDSEDEIMRRFTKTIQRNLHVIFTMNPAAGDFSGRCTTSPALFNRCVVDWFGTWSNEALAQVAFAFISHMDTGYSDYSAPTPMPEMLSLVLHVLGNDNSATLLEAAVAALVTIHLSVKNVAARIGKLTGRTHYLSPRDFIDLIHKMVAAEDEHRQSLQDQQTHIRTGLLKLKETQEQVAELNKEMVAKGAELEHREVEAKEKLTLMVGKKAEAEQGKTAAQKLSVELEERNAHISVKKESVEQDLAEAEPALLAAKERVANIKKAHLDEVRGLARPVKPIQYTMEMVCIMIGEHSIEWTEICKVLRRADFITTVQSFDPKTLTPKQVNLIQKDYLKNAEKKLDHATVDRASKACGPLFMWVESQIKFATVFRAVEPMRKELEELQAESDELSAQHEEAVHQVETLESTIKQYEIQYASAIRASETIKSEMEVVTKRVSRAQQLLSSLDGERVNWEATATSFDEQMATLIGDNLLAAAFLTYGGIFDHKVRKSLKLEWTDTLDTLGIPYRRELDFINYLSVPAEQVKWRGMGLPSDDLATQNAILLERFERYPLVVDPSGQATSFLLQKYAADKIVQTSFLEANFMKTLTSAIRFGSPLLVLDVEKIDPVLNPVLNKEVQKSGGRTLIHIGSEEIDFSPKFLIILVTNNPTAKFAPDICSRVTMINFTVTPASLESQSLGAILKVERPDVDKRRSDVLRLQGEQSARLRHLQDALLNTISQAKTSILDDDVVINMLEKTKDETASLKEEVAKTKDVMEEVKHVSAIYEPLAIAMAAVYFSMEQLSDISFLYQVSLSFFLDIVGTVLKSFSKENASSESAASSEQVAKKRLQSLKKMFFAETSRRMLRGLRYDDKLVFLVRLAQISNQGNSDLELSEPETDFLLKGAAPSLADSGTLQRFKSALPEEFMSEAMARQLMSLSFLPAYNGLLESLTGSPKMWIDFIESIEPEKHVPLQWIDQYAALLPARRALLELLVVKAARPDRLLRALELYITMVFEGVDWRAHCAVELHEIIARDSCAANPMMLCSEAGQDASGRVDSISRQMGKQLLQVSMGSEEGYTQADKLISQAAKSGSWVLLRNVHLCSDWLGMLEKRLHGFKSHDNFRLFLTCEISPKLPSALLRMSEVVVFEASTGIKANIARFFNSIPAARVDKQPAQRCRLYGLLAWLNAVVHERLRYVPLGWTKRYEFSEADTACALDVIDEWVDQTSKGRAQIDPAELPWQALQTLLSQSLYGGRVDHPFDQEALDSFIQSIFNANNYETGAALATDPKGDALVTLPDGLNRSAFEAWVKALPDQNSPAWIGLPATAESHLKSLRAQQTLKNLSLLQLGSLEHGHSETSSSSSEEKAAGSDQQQQQQQAELRSMAKLVDAWTSSLPALQSLPVVDRELTSSATASPLERCVARELVKGRSVLQSILDDLNGIKCYCSGEIKATNTMRDLIGCLRRGIVPPSWKSQYKSSSTLSLGDWISNLSARSQAQQHRYSSFLDVGRTAGVSGADGSRVFWVGGMFDPEAFITATRQYTAQSNQWSLEDVELTLEVAQDGRVKDANDALVEGVMLEGAYWNNDRRSLELSETLRSKLPLCILRWTHKSQRIAAQPAAGGAAAAVHTEYLQLPLYLTEQRVALITEVLLCVETALSRDVWAQRGAAVVLQSSV